MANDANSSEQAVDGTKRAASVKLGTESLKSSYCNVCTVNSTREEMVLNFGLNQDWDRSRKEMIVQLQHRVILSPHGAKRLHERITKLLLEYEARYGELKQ